MNSLTKYENHRDIIEQTVQQINKDFGSHLREPLFLSGSDTPYQQLYAGIHPIIVHLFTQQRTQLQQLLYRIDIPESYMRKMPGQKEEAIHYITNGILERELQKVVIRHNLGTGLSNPSKGQIEP